MGMVIDEMIDSIQGSIDEHEDDLKTYLSSKNKAKHRKEVIKTLKMLTGLYTELDILEEVSHRTFIEQK